VWGRVHPCFVVEGQRLGGLTPTSNSGGRASGGVEGSVGIAGRGGYSRPKQRYREEGIDSRSRRSSPNPRGAKVGGPLYRSGSVVWPREASRGDRARSDPAKRYSARVRSSAMHLRCGTVRGAPCRPPVDCRLETTRRNDGLVLGEVSIRLKVIRTRAQETDRTFD